jgi:MFS family permease
LKSERIPAHARAVFDALQFGEPSYEALNELTEPEWRRLEQFCARSGLTIPFALRCCDSMPHAVAERFDENLRKNAERWPRIKSEYLRVSRGFEAAGLEFAVLKGFSHIPAFVAFAPLRVQSDFDLLFPREQVQCALRVALGLGYEAVTGSDRHPVDHLPTLVRKSGWEWRGDYFDPEMPPSLELHFRLWDARTEGFAVPCVEEFWQRRQRRTIEDLRFTSLAAIDLPGYASAHALRHFLRGDLKPSNIYEIAYFLERNRSPQFWQAWRDAHDQPLRRVEAICFALARQWFGCEPPAIDEAEISQLPEPVRAWLATFGRTPEPLFDPAKNELWLHLSLLDPGRSRLAVLRRRLIPLQVPGPVDAVHLPGDAIDLRIRLRSCWRYLAFVSSRISRHARAFLPTLFSGGLWTWSRMELDRQFWAYFAASACYDFGLFIFFLLFNLYLLKLGYHESFLGLVSGSMMAGGVVGSLPAGIAIERLGLRASMIACFSVIPCMAAILAAGLPAPLLLVCAFLYGLVSVLWAVLLSPAVAALTSARNRSAGFGIICSSGIAIGILGGTVGGRLPGWFARLGPASSVVVQFRAALWVGCSVVLLGLVFCFQLKMRAPIPEARDRRRLGRPPRQVLDFLGAAAVWNLGTGFFSPFFTAFFAHLHMPVERIGLVFSLSQLGQALAILTAPLVFRATGLIRGISRMQLLSALALACIAASGGPGTAALAYGAYMVVQNMSEPGMLNYLMDSVPEAERGSVSALNFLVASCAQAIAAVISGMLLRRLGYPPVLLIAAALCAVAAVLIRSLNESGASDRSQKTSRPEYPPMAVPEIRSVSQPVERP